MKAVRAWLYCLVFLPALAIRAGGDGRQPGSVVAWGRYYDGAAFVPAFVPAGLTNVQAVAGGSGHSVALLPDGTVTAWGYDYYGQTEVPAGLANVSAIACGQYFTLALRADGTVVGWGQYYDGVEYAPVTVPPDLTNVVAVSAGAAHGLALNRDGTVAAWGDDSYGQTDVPLVLSNVVAIAAGERSSLALQADGTLLAWGQFYNGSAYVPAFTPVGLSNTVAISLGAGHGLSLGADGSVVAWGYGSSGQTNTPWNLTNILAIAAGENFSLALRSDASVIAWGSNANGQTNLPVNTNVVQIAAGYYHGLALIAQAPVVWSNAVSTLALSHGQSAAMRVEVASRGSFAVQWFLNGAPLPGATGTNLVVGDFQLESAGAYDARVSNKFGAVNRSIAVLRLTNSPVVLVDGADAGGGTVTRVDTAGVSMSSTFDPQASIYYTLDGSDPDFTAIPYAGPFRLTNSATVRAIAYNLNYSDSAEAAPIQVQIWPTYPLGVYTPGGGEVSASPLPYTADRYLSNTIVTLTAVPEPDWSFMEWSGATESGTNMASVLMNGPTQVQATFGTSLNLYTNGHGQIIANPPSGPYAYGTTVQLTAVPAPGSYFFGWAGAASGSENSLWFDATDASGITALFGALKTNQVALTTLVQGDGLVVLSPSQPFFTNGDLVTLTAIPGSNSVFAGWSGDASGMENPLEVQLNGNEIVTATFAYVPPTNPPSITQQPAGTTASPGSTVVLGVQADGQPPITYQWRFAGVPLAGQTNSQLVLPQITPSQAGAYDVVVASPAGTTLSSSALVGLLSVELPVSGDQALPLLILDSAPGSSYGLEFTEDLVEPNWQLLALVTVQSGRLYYLDQPVSAHDRRFYRAVPQ